MFLCTQAARHQVHLRSRGPRRLDALFPRHPQAAARGRAAARAGAAQYRRRGRRVGPQDRHPAHRHAQQPRRGGPRPAPCAVLVGGGPWPRWPLREAGALLRWGWLLGRPVGLAALPRAGHIVFFCECWCGSTGVARLCGCALGGSSNLSLHDGRRIFASLPHFAPRHRRRDKGPRVQDWCRDCPQR